MSYEYDEYEGFACGDSIKLLLSKYHCQYRFNQGSAGNCGGMALSDILWYKTVTAINFPKCKIYDIYDDDVISCDCNNINESHQCPLNIETSAVHHESGQCFDINCVPLKCGLLPTDFSAIMVHSTDGIDGVDVESVHLACPKFVVQDVLHNGSFYIVEWRYRAFPNPSKHTILTLSEPPYQIIIKPQTLHSWQTDGHSMTLHSFSSIGKCFAFNSWGTNDAECSFLYNKVSKLYQIDVAVTAIPRITNTIKYPLRLSFKQSHDLWRNKKNAFYAFKAMVDSTSSIKDKDGELYDISTYYQQSLIHPFIAMTTFKDMDITSNFAGYISWRITRAIINIFINPENNPFPIRIDTTFSIKEIDLNGTFGALKSLRNDIKKTANINDKMKKNRMISLIADNILIPLKLLVKIRKTQKENVYCLNHGDIDVSSIESFLRPLAKTPHQKSDAMVLEEFAKYIDDKRERENMRFELLCHGYIKQEVSRYFNTAPIIILYETFMFGSLYTSSTNNAVCNNECINNESSYFIDHHNMCIIAGNGEINDGDNTDNILCTISNGADFYELPMEINDNRYNFVWNSYENTNFLLFVINYFYKIENEWIGIPLFEKELYDLLKNMKSTNQYSNNLNYIDHVQQLIIDNLCILMSRPYLRPFLESSDILFMIQCKYLVSPLLYAEDNLFHSMMDEIDFYLHFEIDHFDGRSLTDNEMRLESYHKFVILQKCIYKYFYDKLPEMALCTISTLDDYDKLKGYLNKLNAKDLYELSAKLQILPSMEINNNNNNNNNNLLSLLSSNNINTNCHLSRRSKREQISNLPLYPTESILFDDAALYLNDNGDGDNSMVLGLDKLKSAHSIRDDIAKCIWKIRPRLKRNPNASLKETIFTEYSRMTVPIDKFTITSIFKHNLGEIGIDLKPFYDDILKEWQELKENDVLFLIRLRGIKGIEFDKNSKQNEYGVGNKRWDELSMHELGVLFVRSCQIKRIRDGDNPHNIIGEKDMETREEFVIVKPYYDKKKRFLYEFNSNECSPIQIESIKSGMHYGLTMVVGPPGSGKTDVAVQIINNLYCNFSENERILLVTHSNQALNDLFSKLIERDIDERHLLRLGFGYKSLQQNIDNKFNFSTQVRINYMLNDRNNKSEIAQYLVSTLNISSNIGYCYDAETCAHFKNHILMNSWEDFEDYLDEIEYK